MNVPPPTASLEFAPPSAAPTVLRLLVDAHAAVVHVEVDSPVPAGALAQVEFWRTTQEALEALELSDMLFSHTAPDHQFRPTVTEPDTIVSDAPEGVIRYRHNDNSRGHRALRSTRLVNPIPHPRLMLIP